MANRDQLLVSTDWLADNLDDPNLRVVEVDEDTDAYARGHIRGAVAVNWNTDLQDPLRRDFIAPEQFAKLQDSLGITPDTTVILYGGNNNWFAAYAYWYYKVYGHGPVKLLDGGRKAWELEGRVLTTDPADVQSTSGYPVREPDTSIRAFRDQVLKVVGTGEGAALVDVRSPEEFRGEKLAPDHLPQESAQRPGHAPDADGDRGDQRHPLQRREVHTLAVPHRQPEERQPGGPPQRALPPGEKSLGGVLRSLPGLVPSTRRARHLPMFAGGHAHPPLPITQRIVTAQLVAGDR